MLGFRICEIFAARFRRSHVNLIASKTIRYESRTLGTQNYVKGTKVGVGGS